MSSDCSRELSLFFQCFKLCVERTTWATSSTIEAAEWRMFDLWWIPVPVKSLESRRMHSIDDRLIAEQQLEASVGASAS